MSIISCMHIDDMLHWFFPPLFWNYSLTMICPIQLLRPAKKPMAGPSSCKGQNKVGDNFKIGAQRVNVLVSSMWVAVREKSWDKKNFKLLSVSTTVPITCGFCLLFSRNFCILLKKNLQLTNKNLVLLLLMSYIWK